MAERGLDRMALSGGTGEAAGIGHRQHVLHLLQLHGMHLEKR